MAIKTTNDNGVQSFSFTGNPAADSLLFSTKEKWQLLSGRRITYSFINQQSAPLYAEQFGGEYQASPLTPEIQGYVADSLDRVYGSVINVNFVQKAETSATNSNNVQETTNFGTLRMMFSTTQAGGLLGRGAFPATSVTAGDLYLNIKENYTIGTIGYTAILHEIGHTMGLKHPFSTDGTVLSLEKDNNTYTVMTYNDASYAGSYAVSLMPYDILALQHLYGARNKNRSDTVYNFEDVDRYSVGGSDYYAFPSGHSKSTLWDSGGEDTLDFSAITKVPDSPSQNGFDYRFELKQGGFLTEYSAYSSATYNAYDPKTKEYNLKKPDGSTFTTLNYGTVLAFSPLDGSFNATIENLSGTQRNDYIEGNNVANRLQGNGGDDYINGESGNDILIGGAGNDLLEGGSGEDIIDGGGGIDTVSYSFSDNSEKIGVSIDLSQNIGFDGIDGLDTLIDIENVFGSRYADRIDGDSNSNIIFGDDGNDIINGNGGNDSLLGQSGNDTLIGSDGNDRLDGGADQDTVRYDEDLTGVIVNIDETQGYSNITYSTDLEPTFNIGAGQAFDGFGDTDTLRNLENIIGSAYDDVLIGNALENTLNGLEGNDLLIGNGGIDILDGGDGIDTVSYRRTENIFKLGVVVNLANNSGFDGIDAIDTLISIENIIGSRYADKLDGDSNDNTILGGDGNDTINGNDGDDSLFGESGNDKIFGGDGNDILIGGSGSGWPADILDGGFGNDSASYITATSSVAASLAQGTGWQGDATRDQFISIENLIGSDYDDFLIGDDRANILIGGSGNDTLQGEGGDDTLIGGSGNSTLNAGEGNNIVFALNGDDTVYAGFGNDFIRVGDGRNQVYAGGGNNTIFTGKDNDVIYANSGDDTISAGEGENRVYAGEGRNIITTGNDKDLIYGGSGIDVIRAGDGVNQVFANEGVNLVITGLNDDTIYGGSSLDIIIAGEGINKIFANEGNNIISAGNGENLIYAGSGRDVIRTGSGNDTIYASEGDNYIDAGTGFNTLYSGSGKDLFALYAGNGFSNIINFNADRDILGLVGGLNASNLTLRQVNSGGYFTEVSVTGTGDVLAQLQGIHTNANQISWVALDNPGSSFKNTALSVFENPFTVNNRAEIISAGITTATLNTVL
jgi:Ca2+-binding RTX toxin-like protein